MSVYYKFKNNEGYLILHGDKKKPAKSYVIGVVYDATDADLFVRALQANAKVADVLSEEELANGVEEPVEDLVDELQRGLAFNATGEDYNDNEWQR